MRTLILSVLAVVLAAVSARAEQVVFSEIMYNPPGGNPEFIEVRNITRTPLDFTKWRFTDGVVYEFPGFTGSGQAHILQPLERVVVSSATPAATRAAYGIPASVRVFGPWSGALDNAGERVTLSDKNGTRVCTVNYKDSGRWPRAADGPGHSLVLLNENRAIDDFRVWGASRFAGGTPGTAEITGQDPFPNPEVGAGQGVTAVDYGDTWKYQIPTSDPGTAWRGLSFTDGAWAQGAGLIGLENAPLPAPGIRTQLSSVAPTTYLFRKTFAYGGNPAGATFVVDQIVDDGVTYYLNGQLLGSVRHVPGVWNNYASNVADAVEELNVLNGIASGLVNGTNVLTAEVHQSGAGSSDLVFGARLKLTSPSTIAINEVKPGSAGQGFVEFYNSTDAAVNLNGYYLSDDLQDLTKHRISTNLIVPPNGFATVGFAESQLTSGATTSVFLTQPNGVTRVNGLSAGIPLDGRTLGRAPAGSANWFLFRNATPGAPNFSLTETASNLRLNEVLFGATGTVQWIEVQNLASSAASAEGLFIASRADLADKVALTGSIPADGYASWDISFPVSSSGEVTLFFVDGAGNVLGTADLKRVPGRDSMQALYPTVPAKVPSYEFVRTTPEWYATETPTRNAPNAPARNTSIVINEIMYDPPSRLQTGEFIELYNRGTAPVSLAGWKIRGGIDFDFPATASISAGGYLVVAASAAYIQQTYGTVPVIGDYTGKLSNNGDLIRLIDNFNNLVNEVDYRPAGDWPTLAAGQGSSMELIHPTLDNNRASAWRDSVESTKTSFETFNVVGTYQQLNSVGTITDYRELHLHLVGDGHIELRNITLRQNGTGPNVITKGTTHAQNGSSASGWLMQGTHWASYIDQAGVLHLIADGHGDNRANRAEIDCIDLVAGASYTLQFEARWVSGKPRLIAQTWDHSLGKAFLVPVPNNLGTPGAANSSMLSSAPPQVDSVLHSPAVPRTSDPVTITARVTSSTPLTTVEVVHRVDSITNNLAWVSTPMSDSGTNGDAVANDGLYTAVLTEHQVNSRIVQFYVRATNSSGLMSQLPKNGPEQPALWMVDDRTFNNALRRQRFVMSLYHRDALNTSSGENTKFQYDFPRLSNHYFNATFINDEQEVFYNAELRKAGSPWTRPDSSLLDRGKWKLPGDRIFRNRYKSTYDNDDSNRRHHNRLVRYWLYLLGHPTNENEFVYHLVNSDGLTVREDTEPVGNDMLNRHFENGNDGILMRSDDEWWFADNWSREYRNADWGYKGTDNLIRYHSEWMARTRETEYDYSSLIEFFKTVSNSSSTEERLNRVLDPQLTLMMAAVRGYIDDWDSLTLNRGKNGFFYQKPTDNRWMFMHWDSDNAFGNTGAAVVGSLAGWGTYISKPWTRKILNYYLNELISKHTRNSARVSAWFDAEENSSTAYTVSKSFYESWFANREARIVQEINLATPGGAGNAYNTSFTVTTPGGGSTAANVISLTGTAPSGVYSIVVEGQSGTRQTWANQTTWNISGVLLQAGLNTFTLRALDDGGNALALATYTITKTGDAPPVIQLSANPGSLNIRLGQVAALNASGSFDPERGSLNFEWNVGSAAGVTMSNPSASTASLLFNSPGVYNLTVSATDSAGNVAATNRELLAYNAADFSPMNDPRLESHWLLQNVRERDNAAASSWYSTQDKSGLLVVQVMDDAAKPITFPTATHPLITRSLPATAEFALQTDLTMDLRQTGNFFTGLVVDTTESGTQVRYLFGLESGTFITVKRASQGIVQDLVRQSVSSNAEVLRVRRVGQQLIFQRRVNDAWEAAVHTAGMPSGSQANRGGVFVATTAAEKVRVAFDYIVLADPSNTTTLLNSLRITELMYFPAAPDTVEFIELQNIGPVAINLQGAYFQNGAPVDDLVFGNEVVAPGEFIVVTNNVAAFRSRYGEGPRLAGAWPSGALNNGGEQVVLRDAQGNLIHNFLYDDVSPWPVPARGGGPSIEVINLAGNYSDGANWRASYESGGSPGRMSSAIDTDGDGISDYAELLFGTDPNRAGSRPQATLDTQGSAGPVLSWPTVPGRSYQIQYCDELGSAPWQTLGTVSGTGTATSFTDTTSPRPTKRFYRIAPLP